jgi:hypothetical protein
MGGALPARRMLAEMPVRCVQQRFPRRGASESTGRRRTRPPGERRPRMLLAQLLGRDQQRAAGDRRGGP